MLRSEAAVGGAIRLSTVTVHDPAEVTPRDTVSIPEQVFFVLSTLDRILFNLAIPRSLLRGYRLKGRV